MIKKGLLTSNSDEWTTPKALYDALNKTFNFTLDACANNNNHLCKKYYTKENSCLNKEWKNEIVFMNPPYGRKIKDFIDHAYMQALKYKITIIMLLPARTDTIWFHDYIYKSKMAKIQFIKGRLKFGNSKNSAPFPSMIVYYNAERYLI